MVEEVPEIELAAIFPLDTHVADVGEQTPENAFAVLGLGRRINPGFRLLTLRLEAKARL